MKVLVFGASGIIGQHMMLTMPAGAMPVFFRRNSDRLFLGCDVTDPVELIRTLDEHKPAVVVNLAGESNTDFTEANPFVGYSVNVNAVDDMRRWCQENGAHLVHVSSQSVFSGDGAPYAPDSARRPINKYGRQKCYAEGIAEGFANCTIIRPTFVLGVRPIATGRANPAEQMLAGQRKQVADRWFSPLFARDAARGIWSVIMYGLGKERIVHLGEPRRVSRYDVAQALGTKPEAVSHDDFPGIAPRPVDTTYAAETTRHWTPWEDGIRQIKKAWRDKQMLTINERAREVALFLKINEDVAHAKLAKGFGALHHEVTADFRRANPQDDASLLEWYRRTEAYIWELSAYHCDEGWNYMGMCGGLVERLRADSSIRRVLCLGDGIGDITLAMRRAGYDATYHDLAGSRTAEFAAFRFYMHGAEGPSEMTDGWEPRFSEGFDCVISFDFLEHVTDVPAWTAAIKKSLRPGGLFCAQNAFAIGSGDQGSIPMHLSRNDKYEKEWDPHLASLGFRQRSSNWYEVAA